jgi:biopolymer transport protein ExbB
MISLETALGALRSGGVFVYPLFALLLIALVVVLDRLYVFWRFTRLPGELRDFVERPDFGWGDLDQRLSAGRPTYFVRFFRIIMENRAQPPWWIESRAADEASLIEKSLQRGLWVLDTIVTAAPLLGLLGTIFGMISAFHLFGAAGLVDPGAVTGGVAEALVATAIGICIAVLCLFAFNFFSRLESQVMDEMERLGTRLVDRVRLDEGAHP